MGIEQILPFLLPIALGVIMFGIGLNLEFVDFKRVFTQPKAIFAGLFGQLFLMPLIAFFIAFFAPIDNVFKVGLVLIAACPGGTSSNIVTYILNGRIALSVSLTSINSFLILITIPFYINWASELFLEQSNEFSLSFLATAKEIFLTVLIPTLLGAYVNFKFYDKLYKLKTYLKFILPAILFVVFSLVLLNENNNESLNLSDYFPVLFFALLLNVTVMFVGFYFSKFIGINHKGRYTVAVEMGLQNSALAIFIASSVLNNVSLGVVAVVYGGFSFFSTLLIAFVMKKYMLEWDIKRRLFKWRKR